MLINRAYAIYTLTMNMYFFNRPNHGHGEKGNNDNNKHKYLPTSVELSPTIIYTKQRQFKLGQYKKFCLASSIGASQRALT